MSAHVVLEGHQTRIQEILDQQEKARVVNLLPPLTRGIQDLVRQAFQLRAGQAIWREVYQQRAISGYNTSWKKFQSLASRLIPAENILDADAAGISSLAEETNKTTQELRELNRKATTAWDKWRQERLQEIESVKALLKIPDLFPEEKERRKVEKLTEDIAGFLDQPAESIVQTGLRAQARRWLDLKDRFDQVQSQLSFEAIGETYSLSAETVSLIQELVAGQTPTLDKISAQTLSELSRFARFRALVRLSFVP